MRSYLLALRTAAGLGTLVGAAAGAFRWSQAWPELSALALARMAVLGWVIGVAASTVLCAMGRRVCDACGADIPALPRPPRRRWTRIVRAALTVAAVAPILLVLILLPLHGPRRRSLGAVRRPEDARPNLILITIDALRADHLGAYGRADRLTPNLDTFAETATVYDSAYVSSPWTLTSFASIFSSRPPSECGLKLTTPRMHNWYLYSAKLPKETPLVSEQLQRAGYVTAAELTNCFLTEQRGWQRGFDYFRNEDGPELGAILTRADTVTRNARAWLRLRPRKPFFLWIHYLDPHVPYNSPDTPRELTDEFPRDWLTRREYWYSFMRGQDDATKARYAEFCRKMYAEEVRYTDRWLGDLLAEIKSSGDWDRSLIVIASDHGEELFDHGEFEHGHSMYQELLRVPLLVKWPAGVRADPRVAQVVSMMDLAPTFVEFAGAAPLPGSVGRPLPRRDGGRDEAVYAEGVLHGPEQTALTASDYKLIHRAGTQLGGEEFVLYDRRADRGERKPVTEGGPEVEMQRRLRSHEAKALAAARRWTVSSQPEFRGIDLSHATREKLRALGYIGE